MLRFSLRLIEASPWKNGGGVTREIVVWPPGASLHNFEWRISVATISASGPFSSFPGIDRVIMLLEGDGVALSGRAIDHRLDRVGLPFAFEGDQVLDCTLLGGPSSDFNVMSRRKSLRTTVDMLDSDTKVTRGCGGLAMSLSGHWLANGEPIDPWDGFWWSDTGEPIELRCVSAAAAQLVYVRFDPRV